jgi:hypothetical protein
MRYNGVMRMAGPPLGRPANISSQWSLAYGRGYFTATIPGSARGARRDRHTCSRLQLGQELRRLAVCWSGEQLQDRRLHWGRTAERAKGYGLRIASCRQHLSGAVGAMHAQGMHRRVEHATKGFRLSLPRRSIRRYRQEHLRPAAIAACRAGDPSRQSRQLDRAAPSRAGNFISAVNTAPRCLPHGRHAARPCVFSFINPHGRVVQQSRRRDPHRASPSLV